MSLFQISKAEATAYAKAAADAFKLPQTVYRSPGCADWEHTHSLSGRLHRAELAVTILPRNYFR